ncbi:ABC transporter permease [Sporosarcina cascadiensis]|uniref:ABC transporter permease n=1 Tax=Sporosarcina cascadiensis TaxID=2660747 RepID=UPI00129AF3A0|nr:ABC transporter permease [Sporosarcina cascadiensis]
MTGKWIVKRMMMGMIVLIIVSFFSFWMLDRAPGNLAAAYYGGNAQTLNASEIERINETFGLDRSIKERYGAWLYELANGNMGYSLKEGRPVLEVLGEKVPNTLVLVLTSLMLIIALSLPLGLIAGLNKDSLISKLVSYAGVLMSSIPAFWLGLVLIWIFSLQLGLLPSSGIKRIGGTGYGDRFVHLVMPVTVLVISHVGLYARFLQESIIAESEKYYVLVALANGVGRKIIKRGMLKNALSPYISYFATTIPSFFGGTVIIESLFSYGGLGQLLVNAVSSKDFPLLMGGVMTMGIFVVVTLFIADCILYAVNPRLRREGAR